MVENFVQILIGCPLDFQAGTGGGQKKTYYFKSGSPNNHKKPKTFNFFNQSTSQPYSEVQIQNPFSFQLGFSMTVHKAQERTIDKIVLDLHYKPNYNKRLKFHGIFVALSRVRCRSSIRLIKHHNTSFGEAYGYISRLSPAPNVMAFYRGFTGNPEEGQVWNMQLALGVPNWL
jgi:hypothetical protein